jgi:hypothetical protein
MSKSLLADKALVAHLRADGGQAAIVEELLPIPDAEAPGLPGDAAGIADHCPAVEDEEIIERIGLVLVRER